MHRGLRDGSAEGASSGGSGSRKQAHPECEGRSSGSSPPERCTLATCPSAGATPSWSPLCPLDPPAAAAKPIPDEPDHRPALEDDEERNQQDDDPELDHGRQGRGGAGDGDVQCEKADVDQHGLADLAVVSLGGDIESAEQAGPQVGPAAHGDGMIIVARILETVGWKN